MIRYVANGIYRFPGRPRRYNSALAFQRSGREVGADFSEQYSSYDKKSLEVEFEDNLLTVRTKQVNKSEENNVDGEIIHKGISQRQFARSFTIADDVKVNGAQLRDGLLTISCERIIPEHKKKKLIEIK